MTPRRLRLPLLQVSLTLALAFAVFVAPKSLANRDGAARAEKLGGAASVRLLERIRLERRGTWRWQRLIGAGLTSASRAIEDIRAVSSSRVLGVWTRRAARARRLALHPPHRQAWLCIHRYEGSWTDPNPPYYGGLQMDLGFQRTYGADLLSRKGTADHWTPLEQMWVAERAYRSGQGFYPWPNTARYCGLI